MKDNRNTSISSWPGYSVDCAGNVYKDVSGPKGATYKRRVPTTDGFVLLRRSAAHGPCVRKVSVEALLRQVFGGEDVPEPPSEETHTKEVTASVDYPEPTSTNRRRKRSKNKVHVPKKAEEKDDVGES